MKRLREGKTAKITEVRKNISTKISNIEFILNETPPLESSSSDDAQCVSSATEDLDYLCPQSESMSNIGTILQPLSIPRLFLGSAWDIGGAKQKEIKL